MARGTRERNNEAWRKRVALWRYEQIAELLPTTVSRSDRAEGIRRLSERPVAWPQGKIEPIPSASAYRWIRLYRKGGLSALKPRVRKDRGEKRALLSDEIVDKAVMLWADDPDMSMTFLLGVLHADKDLGLSEKRIEIKRSTLHRRLRAHPLYVQLSRAKKRTKKRTRYAAKYPHDIWHLDAKGPVEVRLISKKILRFHILTVLDGATRDALAWIISLNADLKAAVRVFRLAAKRYGLPMRVCIDRASIFESHAFREGLADLGAHRIRVRPRNPETNGKIEAYHRSLVLWFTKRLPGQNVVDEAHLQNLLDAVIETLYRDHTHRELGISPRAALAGEISSRAVSPQRLDDAFRIRLEKKSHPKTGEIDLPSGKYLVPEDLRGQRLEFRLDPENIAPPIVVDPVTEKHRSLIRAEVSPRDVNEPKSSERYGEGPLQTLYDHFKGKVRPNAEPGFGLPEIFALLTKCAGRLVPQSDAEASLIHRTYRKIGPLPKIATEKAFAEIERELGKKRPIQIYLDALEKRQKLKRTES